MEINFRGIVLLKKGDLKSCAKFTGRNPCWSLFFNKVAGLGPAKLCEKKEIFAMLPEAAVR